MIFHSYGNVYQRVASWYSLTTSQKQTCLSYRCTSWASRVKHFTLFESAQLQLPSVSTATPTFLESSSTVHHTSVLLLPNSCCFHPDESATDLSVLVAVPLWGGGTPQREVALVDTAGLGIQKHNTNCHQAPKRCRNVFPGCNFGIFVGVPFWKLKKENKRKFYPLIICYLLHSYWKYPMFVDLPIEKWWCSIVMLVYQRVPRKSGNNSKWWVRKEMRTHRKWWFNQCWFETGV